ncbi:MAG: primary-amine oxidase [Actinobacteria bacterium]|nr:primary-amine oxidase [Actinomycetota bacterium]
MSAARHPLDPLTEAEVRAAVAAARGATAELGLPAFWQVSLQDPPKAEVVAHVAGARFERRAFVGMVDRADGAVYELLVRLADAPAEASAGGATVESCRRIEGVQPPILPEDYTAAIAAVEADERFRIGLRRRGIEDLSLIQIDALTAGHFPQNPEGRRIIWATPYLRQGPGSNPYARPIEHLRAAVDLNSGEVVEVIDDDPVVPLSTVDGDYATEADVGGWRTDIAPLEIVQPDGPGFRLDGNEIAWQRWRMHIGLHPVDGLVLSHIRYEDEGVERQIVYRAAVSEMVVPYGDPHKGFYWRTYFDGGEYGLGRNANSLTLGCDCLGEIRYLDGVQVDAAGEPSVLTNAICIHEEDDSILWKHTDPGIGDVQVRRSRRLVISSIATVGNYDYGFYWSFFQDGSIELEVKLTGIVLTRGVFPDQELRHGERVAPDLAAPHHQHLFNVRLDMAVDGFENTVEEVDLVACEAGPDNPWGQALETRVETIERESAGKRSVEPAANRSWRIVNRGVRNHLGEPVGYRLVPFNGPTLLASPDSSVGRRAGFAGAHLWVTRYAPDELHAAGDYPNQHPGGAGLPEWIEQDRDLLDTDVVVWHTLGVSHAVRPEDWPIMPVDRVAFMLRPVGFFRRNPAVDVPPSEPGHCRAGGEGRGHCGSLGSDE